MVTFEELLNDMSENLSEYAKSQWDSYLSQVKNDLSSLNEYYSYDTPENVTLLKKNLPYIKKSNNISNGSAKGFDGQKTFTYYGKVNNKPLLGNPNEDKQNDVKDGFDGISIKGVINDNGSARVESFYNERETGGGFNTSHFESNLGESYETLASYSDIGIVNKTSQWMRHAMKDEKQQYIADRFKTIISRFHTDKIDAGDVGNSAKSKVYGESHGRNLLKVNSNGKVDTSGGNGYSNPYCRVWTWHHQYKNYIQDTMRPFLNGNGTPLTQQELTSDYNWSSFRSLRTEDGGDGGNRLAQHGSMYDNGGNFNGLVNITPVWQGQEYDSESNVNLKHCMFSIENLAWKGVFNDYDETLSEFEQVEAFRGGLSREQKGPLGGRIMWFPPYDLSFSENTNVEWNSNVFIGRGEPMYTYSNTSRSGTLRFKLLIDHPAILDYWERRKETPTGTSKVDDVKSKEQEMLRFFAGCSVLKASVPKWKNKVATPDPDPQPEVKSSLKKIQFFVFFPNNYSGMNDGFGGSNTVNPIDYLINGVGAQRKYSSSSKKGVDFAVDMSSTVRYNRKTVGGYEVRDCGVSLVSDTTYDNTIASNVAVGSSRVTLMKMYNEKSKKGTPTKITNGDQTNAWHKGRYYYRADTNTLDQVLLGEGATSYIDKKSYKLNSTGYKQAVSHYGKSLDTTYSFTDMYVALNPKSATLLKGCYSSENVAKIKKVLEGSQGKITKVDCQGRASTQTNSNNSDKNQLNLASHRAETIQKWLKKALPNGVQYSTTRFKVSPEQSLTSDDSNDYMAKLTRVVFVTIYYNPESVGTATQTQSQVDKNGSESSSVKYKSGQNSKASYETQAQQTSSTAVTLGNITVTASAKQKQLGRYDNEAQFFERIGSEDPFAAHLLSERIRFFNPAFHSMSPEGFNARLTFLNQCCRQGPTYSHSQSNDNADNLAFGRPPICVLRVGDFYNTKIVINSLNISYDPLTWDLNEEGIGVMPMIANVDISFNFIGGSELGGPVERLQNALSYNYYANTSVYDNRAEQINYGNFGVVDSFKPWQAEGQIFHSEADMTNNEE